MRERKRDSKSFTAGEVATLIEAQNNEIRILAEGIADMRSKVNKIDDTVIPLLTQHSEGIAIIKVEMRAVRTELTDVQGEALGLKAWRTTVDSWRRSVHDDLNTIKTGLQTFGSLIQTSEIGCSPNSS